MYIGTYILTFKVEYKGDGPVITYSPHKTVIENTRGDRYRRMYIFVTSPIVIPFSFRCPKRTVVDSEDEVLNEIILP